MEAAGLIMGEMEIIRPNGEKTTIRRDGSVEITPSSIAIEWCDVCETWKHRDWGFFEGSEGITYIWKCFECRDKK